MTTIQPHQEQIDEQPTLWEVTDELWARLAPILVIDKPRKKSGRPPRDARTIFNALIWLGRTGSQWSQVPRHYAPKSTVHDRLKVWAEQGCLQQAWAVLLQEYGELLGINWEWQLADGCIAKAPLGKRGPPGNLKRLGATPPTEARRAANEPS